MICERRDLPGAIKIHSIGLGRSGDDVVLGLLSEDGQTLGSAYISVNEAKQMVVGMIKMIDEIKRERGRK